MFSIALRIVGSIQIILGLAYGIGLWIISAEPVKHI